MMKPVSSSGSDVGTESGLTPPGVVATAPCASPTSEAGPRKTSRKESRQVRKVLFKNSLRVEEEARGERPTDCMKPPNRRARPERYDKSRRLIDVGCRRPFRAPDA